MGDGLTFQSVICDSYSNKCRLCLGDSAVNVLLLKNKDGMLDLLSRSSGIDVRSLGRGHLLVLPGQTSIVK